CSLIPLPNPCIRLPGWFIDLEKSTTYPSWRNLIRQPNPAMLITGCIKQKGRLAAALWSVRRELTRTSNTHSSSRSDTHPSAPAPAYCTSGTVSPPAESLTTRRHRHPHPAPLPPRREREQKPSSPRPPRMP